MTVDAHTGSDDRDTIRILAVFGFAESEDLSLVRPFRLSTLREMIVSRLVFMKSTGLEFSDFSENPWGFPFIPYPASNPSRLPENIDPSWLGHPIFWIDPKITEPTEDEKIDPARWSVRMFFVIMALQLWDESDNRIDWFDAISARGVEPVKDDFQSYRVGADSDLDTVFWDATDMVIPYEQVLRESERAIKRCTDLQRSEWTRFRTEQITAYADGVRILKDESAFQERQEILASVRYQFTQRVEEKGIRADLVDPAIESVNKIASLLGNMDRVSLILNSSTYRESADDQVAYGQVAGMLSQYQTTVVDNGYRDTLTELVGRMFDLDQYEEGIQFAELEGTVESLYLDAFRRVQVAVVNFLRTERGETPYGSYEEMQMIDSLGETPEEMISPESLMKQMESDSPSRGEIQSRRQLRDR